MIIKKERKVITKKLNKKDQEKIDSLKSVIDEAEKNLYSAKAMLARLEKKEKPSFQKKTYGASPNGKIVEGIFDGQIMISNDGKQYPVPANYASKSKLVEGDMLKLTMTDDGNFIYKQIGPVERKRLIGIIKEDESGNYVVQSEGGNYKVLLASVTFFRAQPGDEVAIIIPKDGTPVWSAIENVIKKNSEIGKSELNFSEVEKEDPFVDRNMTENRGETAENSSSSSKANKVVEEWIPNISEIEKENRKDEGTDENLKNYPNVPEFENNDLGEKIPIKVGSEGGMNSPKNFPLSEKPSEKIVKDDFPDTPREFFKS
jgi:hypothetical protein